MKGRFTGIFLLFCLAAPIAVTFTFLHHKKYQIRKEVKRQIISGLDKDELVLLKFTEDQSIAQLQWKHAKEFKFKDEMYDIIETQIKGDTIYYWCWWDHHETKLNKQLDELTSIVLGNDPPYSNTQKQLSNFLKSLICPKMDVSSPVQGVSKRQRFAYGFDYTFSSSPPPYPPPEIS